MGSFARSLILLVSGTSYFDHGFSDRLSTITCMEARAIGGKILTSILLRFSEFRSLNVLREIIAVGYLIKM